MKVLQQLQVLADKGDQGIHRYPPKSCLPYKKPRKGKLTSEQKQHNKEQDYLRIRVEKVIRNSIFSNFIKPLSQQKKAVLLRG
jgi:hypothetical protein